MTTRIAPALLCLPWVIVTGAMVLAVFRGLFYGLVDDGPYDTSWGGPTRAGAWLAHAGVGVVTILVCCLLVVGLGRLARNLAGGGRARGSVAVTLLLASASVLLLVAWGHQL